MQTTKVLLISIFVTAFLATPKANSTSDYLSLSNNEFNPPTDSPAIDIRSIPTTPLELISKLPTVKIDHSTNSLLITEYDIPPKQKDSNQPTFIRYYNSANTSIDLGLGTGWSSNFHSRILFSSASRLELLTPQGFIVSFYKSAGKFHATQSHHGSIEKKAQFLIWTAPYIGSIQFKGSLPTVINTTEQQSYKLFYKQNQLIKVTNQENQSLRFLYNSDDNHLSDVLISDTIALKYTYSDNTVADVGITLSRNHTNTGLAGTPKTNTIDRAKTVLLRKYGLSSSRETKQAVITSVSLALSSNRWSKAYEATYNEQGQLQNLLNHVKRTSTKLREDHIQHSFLSVKNGEEKDISAKNDTSAGELNLDANCTTCKHSISIYFDVFGNPNNVRRNNFRASWQDVSELSDRQFKVHQPEYVQQSSGHVNVLTNTVQIEKRNSKGRPVLLTSKRFGQVRITYKNSDIAVQSKERKAEQQLPISLNDRSDYQIRSVNNTINSVNLATMDDSERSRSYPLNDISPRSMAMEAATIVHLDTIARSYQSQQCMISTTPVPDNADLELALDSLPTDIEVEPDSQCDESDESPNELRVIASNENILATYALSSLSSQNITTTYVDIQPEDCSSYFDIESPIARGNAIEQAIAQHNDYSNALHTAYWFPVVDFLIGRTAVVQISRDLTVASYTGSPNQQTLLNRLLQEGAMIDERFLQPLYENGFVTASDSQQTTTITQNQIDSVVFELIIQQGSINPDQLRQIELARVELMALYNISLSIITIP